MAKLRNFKIWRGDSDSGDLVNYQTEIDEGMVVLDAIHRIQVESAQDMAVRWNCKAGKCGSCSIEINGVPKLACMTRMNDYGEEETISCRPMKSFPVLKDLVTDVSWNYRQNQRIEPFKPRPREQDGNHRMMQEDVDRVQEFRKCIECYLCQNTCHVLRDHQKNDEFVGPRFMIRLASLEMHPLDTADRIPKIREEYGSGMCNITKCCTVVCPEHIEITDNGIIPLKERVVDRYYDPILWLKRKLFGKKDQSK
ncbi:MAG: succinate dehydrogenase/fumarate reductase iron-sulfur subunit [Cyclobacteriaceae bacterium]|nr:succinate dehydrogenase/fumarate reductase iron-sulfur subunit [Cyclobacteriaceae bacterium]